MLKRIAALIAAFWLGSVVTTLRKDKDILRLQKKLSYFSGYRYFSIVFMEGWNAGITEGRRYERYIAARTARQN